MSSCGDRKRRKYHDESTKVSIVSLSRAAGPPQVGQATLTHSVAAASGEVALGLQVRPAQLGQLDGQLVLGHGDLAATGQWMTGIGAPQ